MTTTDDDRRHRAKQYLPLTPCVGGPVTNRPMRDGITTVRYKVINHTAYFSGQRKRECCSIVATRRTLTIGRWQYPGYSVLSPNGDEWFVCLFGRSPGVSSGDSCVYKARVACIARPPPPLRARRGSGDRRRPSHPGHDGRRGRRINHLADAAPQLPERLAQRGYVKVADADQVTASPKCSVCNPNSLRCNFHKPVAL